MLRLPTAMFLAALVGTACAGAFTAFASPGPEVVTETGRVRGVVAGTVVAFKGIPFAAPPVGPNRWRAPQPAEPWAGVRAAGDYGHDCMQAPLKSDIAPLGTEPAEDCLYANIWKPVGTAGKRPVLVWIYGGGFVNGGASTPMYSGEELAKDGIVVVSFNYRVGRFGTFAYPRLPRDEGSPNYGYMDQLAALRWVRRNVAAFDGDPDDVTVVGESAGGMSVLTLLTSPSARGLFGKAVVQSGDTGMIRRATVTDAEATGVAFGRENGIDDGDGQAAAKLRALPAETVAKGVDLGALAAVGTASPATFSSPVVDGRLALDPLEALKAREFQRMPVMIGSTSADIDGPLLFMARGARQTARLLAEAGVPTWQYRFSYVAERTRGAGTKGAPHAGDIPFFFRTVDRRYGDGTTGRDLEASRIASGYLVNFVKTGTPNGPGLPTWPAQTVSTDPVLDLTADGGAAVTATR